MTAMPGRWNGWKMNTQFGTNLHSTNELAEIEAFIRAGAERLFGQFEKSNGYTSLGDSQLAEAAILMHVASSASQRRHAVWPESPFRDRPDEGTKHLDLLIDLNPDKYEAPILVTIEGKAVSEGFVAKKIREIVRDYGRVCEWNRLDRQGVPIFYALNDPGCVYGTLVVLCTEKLGADHKIPAGAFSAYWKTLHGAISEVSDTLKEALGTKLHKAIRRDVVNCPYMDGGIHYSVAYAVFESTDETSGLLRHTAEHEAAHAIVAIRSGLKVTGITLLEEGPLSGGVVCDWKASRHTMSDEQLITSSFALAYAGAVIDMERTGKGIGETIGRLEWDKIAIEDSRRTAVEWQLSSSIAETSALSAAGIEKAISLINEHRGLIHELADELMVKISLDEKELADWYVIALSKETE
jgi:hypothetical protein